MSTIAFKKNGRDVLHAHGFRMSSYEPFLVCEKCGEYFDIFAFQHATNLWGTTHGSGNTLDVTCCTRIGAIDIRAITYANGITHAEMDATPCVETYSIDTDSSAAEALEHTYPLDEPSTEPAEKPLCRWCKGAGEITVNFKTKPCECVTQCAADCVDKGVVVDRMCPPGTIIVGTRGTVIDQLQAWAVNELGEAQHDLPS